MEVDHLVDVTLDDLEGMGIANVDHRNAIFQQIVLYKNQKEGGGGGREKRREEDGEEEREREREREDAELEGVEMEENESEDQTTASESSEIYKFGRKEEKDGSGDGETGSESASLPSTFGGVLSLDDASASPLSLLQKDLSPSFSSSPSLSSSPSPSSLPSSSYLPTSHSSASSLSSTSAPAPSDPPHPPARTTLRFKPTMAKRGTMDERTATEIQEMMTPAQIVMKEAQQKMSLRLSTLGADREGRRGEEREGDGEEGNPVKSVKGTSTEKLPEYIGVASPSVPERKYITLGPETARSAADKPRGLTLTSLQGPPSDRSLSHSANLTYTHALLSPRSSPLSPPSIAHHSLPPAKDDAIATTRGRASTTTTAVKKKNQIRSLFKMDGSSSGGAGGSGGQSLLIASSSVTPAGDDVEFRGAEIGYGDLRVMLVSGQRCLMSSMKKWKEAKWREGAIVTLCRLEQNAHVLSVWGTAALTSAYTPVPSASPSDATHIVTEYADGVLAGIFQENKAVTLFDRMILCVHIAAGHLPLFLSSSLPLSSLIFFTFSYPPFPPSLTPSTLTPPSRTSTPPPPSDLPRIPISLHNRLLRRHAGLVTLRIPLLSPLPSPAQMGVTHDHRETQWVWRHPNGQAGQYAS